MSILLTFQTDRQLKKASNQKQSSSHFNTPRVIVGPKGFIVRENVSSNQHKSQQDSLSNDTISFPSSQQNDMQSISSEVNDGNSINQVQRHLISGRDFEDILEACRPRNRGESAAGMPSTLTALLNNSTQHTVEMVNAGESKDANGNSAKNIESSEDAPEIGEWGTVNFDVRENEMLDQRGMSPIMKISGQGSPNFSSILIDHEFSGSESSSPASSFTSNYSYLLSRSPASPFHSAHITPRIQQQPSLSLDFHTLKYDGNYTEGKMKQNQSDGSLQSRDTEDSPVSPKLGNQLKSSENILSNDKNAHIDTFATNLRKLMSDYDSGVFISNAAPDNFSSRFGNPRRYA